MSGEYIQARGDKVKEVIVEQNSKQAPSAKMQLQQNSKQGREAPSALMQLQLQTRVGSMVGKYHWGKYHCLLCTLDPGRLRAHHYAGRICHNYYYGSSSLSSAPTRSSVC